MSETTFERYLKWVQGRFPQMPDHFFAVLGFAADVNAPDLVFVAPEDARRSDKRTIIQSARAVFHDHGIRLYVLGDLLTTADGRRYLLLLEEGEGINGHTAAFRVEATNDGGHRFVLDPEAVRCIEVHAEMRDVLRAPSMEDRDAADKRISEIKMYERRK